MPFFLPDRLDVFPHPLTADDDGLLAISPMLNADSLLLSYRFGIFPWYHESDPVMWWFTHPRFVLYPEKLKVSKSLNSTIRKTSWEITMDKDFEAVIRQCKTIKRRGQESTWITRDLQNAFLDLHKRGFAHSVEVWEKDILVGGLYGLSIGKVFFGESMFSKKSSASKIAFVQLSNFLKARGFKLIDCQQETDHLRQFGAELISAENFLDVLRNNIFAPPDKGKWSYDRI